MLNNNKKDSEYDFDSMYLNKIQEKFYKAWDGTVLGTMMLKQTKQRAVRVSFDRPAYSERGAKLQTATIVSTMFSPYLMARALQLCH